MVYVESAVRSRQIIAAARVVITRDGVAGTTVRAVALEAAIPLGTLQYVFPTRQQLLSAVIEDLVEEIASLQRAAAGGGEGNAIDSRQLARLVVAGVDGLILQYVVNPDPDRGREDIEALITMISRHADAS